MTDVKNCLTNADHISSTATAAAATCDPPAITPTAEEENAVTNVFEATQVTPQKIESADDVDDGANGTPPASPFVLKAPRSNSKLILQNMEEVLNSVKKKHRQKHKRKKEQKRLAQLAEAEAAANGVWRHHADDKTSKLPLREKPPLENGQGHSKSKHKSRKSPLKCSTPVAENSSILKHFPRTPKKDSPTMEAKQTCDGKEEVSSAALSKPVTKPANAFELMMSARNRSIGTNANGQELTPASPTVDVVSPKNVNRKLILQEWADRKGGVKRKIEEEARAAYVDHQLEQRAKRLKKLLTQPLAAEDKHEAIKVDTPKQSEQATKKSKRGRRRTRRLSSVDTVMSSESIGKKPDADSADEFLSKLNSPTKKRDSLLGYFPKVESPKELEPIQQLPKGKSVGALLDSPAELIVVTPKRRKRGPAPKTANKLIEESPVVAESKTPSCRPRRSCAGKTRYDIDLETSPTKTVAVKPCKANTGKQKPMDTSIEIIDLDNSDSLLNLTSTPQTPKRLAPLFVRHMPKPSPDPSKLRAREEFLRSGVPNKLKQEQARQRHFEQCYEENYEHFPRVSHVQQLSDDCVAKLAASVVSFRFKLKDLNEMTMSADSEMKLKLCAIGGISNCTPADFRQKRGNTLAHPIVTPLPVIDNKRNLVKTWKTEFDRFPTYKCYNQMCEKYRHFRAIDSVQDTQQVSESFVVTRRSRRSLEAEKFKEGDAADAKPPAAAPNGELLFTEKYKPLLFEQVLVNLTPVQQLRDFLANWSSGSTGNNTPGGSLRSSQNLDETFDFANDSNSSSASVSNTMVLLGPSSSGKTNAVFTLANDLNFNVLEINAGMRRTGKKLIQELQEATQSHQIRKDSKSVAASKQLLKISLNGLKSKRKNSQAPSEQAADDLGQSVRKSLILIEDADIHFDQTDAGFTDAIYTLAASSKRPVIVVATDPNCAHLQRLMQQNKIEFNPPNVLSICKFLSVLALIENCPIQLDDLISLYSYNNRNLRKTLLELQFFIQSGGDRRAQESKTALALPSTPKKQQQKTPTANTTSPYYASPSKQSLKEDPDSMVEQDEQLVRQRAAGGAEKKNDTPLYMHHTLFEFYTCAQNERLRIPFPLDFQLLHLNLSDLLRSSDKLHKLEITDGGALGKSNNNGGKRRTRSPKKAWLNSVAQNCDDSKAKSKHNAALTALCDFYENISVASMLGTRDTELFADRLMPHLAEDMAHSLVEQALNVQLKARDCAYNLFDTPPNCPTLSAQLGLQSRTRSTRALDYEPALRTICRSERLRASSERRSSRFYHYLRCCTVNPSSFSTEQYDAVCEVFQETKSEPETVA